MATRSRPTGANPPKSDVGLSEWTSRIKALQRQVDEDDETEQRKLEEEIAASRLKRLRRSQMYSNHPSTPDVALDLSTYQSIEEDVSVMNKNESHADVLHKSNSTGDDSRQSELMELTPKLIPAKLREGTSDAISLAALIGGNASGPRLNKHRPQQDAHNPTEFTSPPQHDSHPVFGRGGIAMPGMASSSPISPITRTSTAPPMQTSAHSTMETSYSPKPLRERKASTPSIAHRYVDAIEAATIAQPAMPSVYARSRSRERTKSQGFLPDRSKSREPVLAPAQPPFDPPRSRDRTMSNPGGSIPIQRTGGIGSERHPSPTPITPASSVSTTNNTTAFLRTTASQRPASAAPSIPISRPTVTPTLSPNAKGTLSTTPSLARAIQPSPKASPHGGPQLVPSNTGSPAFLRPAAQKEPTPSLSRLRGRGFVQSMVQREAVDTSPGVSTPLTPTKRVAAIIDKWAAPPPQPISFSPSPRPPSRGTTPVAPHDTLTTLSSAPPLLPKVLPSVERAGVTTPEPPEVVERTMDKQKSSSHDQGVKVGSSNTMISYIKPMKTGDSPPTDVIQPPRPKTPHDDNPTGEFGQRVRFEEEPIIVNDVPLRQPEEHPAESRPLSHPTKQRAKKPRKTRESRGPKSALSSTSKAPETSKSPSTKRARESVVKFADPPVETPILAQSPTSAPASTRTSTPLAPAIKFPAAEGKQDKTTPPSRNSKVTDRWADMPVIAPKTPRAQKSVEFVGLGRAPGLLKNDQSPRPLPGMSPSPVLPQSPPTNEPNSPPRERSPITPRPRIPSTGNRATVMDVVQVFSEQTQPASTSTVKEPSPAVESSIAVDISTPASTSTSGADSTPELSKDAPSMPPSQQPTVESPLVPSPSVSSRGVSAYSASTLPTLKEEATPAPSPAGTLSRVVAKTNKLDGGIDTGPKKNSVIKGHSKESTASSLRSTDSEVRIDLVDREFLPDVDIQKLVDGPSNKYMPSEDLSTISVEVLSIVGVATTPVSKDAHICYDNDVLAVVQRSKSQSSKLVSTVVWGWIGRKAPISEREEHKLIELAKRYGTPLIRVEQFREPAELVHAIGGQLITRQGTRTHWSVENTAMHLVRAVDGSIFIDEHDLNAANLCSAYSYVVTILDTVYIWHGRGSMQDERVAALAYAQSFATADNLVELTEGINDDDMFWLMLGKDEYAQADYWRWRPEVGPSSQPRLWRVEASNAIQPVEALNVWPNAQDLKAFVYLIDSFWELFVLVGEAARGKRTDILLALKVAQEISAHNAPNRPFDPIAHVLVLPSRVPLDLRLAFRGFDEIEVNGGEVPDHMNLVSIGSAFGHLETELWPRAALKDPLMLPLGVHPSML